MYLGLIGVYFVLGGGGEDWQLVFSDEFETEGRRFYPGDDPYWEAVDLHYWGTGDLEWFVPFSSPSLITQCRRLS